MIAKTTSARIARLIAIASAAAALAAANGHMYSDQQLKRDIRRLSAKSH
jgi:hypothetical protein